MNGFNFPDLKKCHNLFFRILLMICFTCAGQVTADETVPRIYDGGYGHWNRASDSELDQQRGGFVLPNGVQIDFRLERITSINGMEIFNSLFQLPEKAFLVQNGSLNQSPELTGLGLGSVIQNNLDNQTIKNVTEINIAVSQLKNLDLNNNGAVFTNFIQPNAQ